MGQGFRSMWGRASALQRSADLRQPGSSGAYSGCPEWRRMTPPANVRCPADAPSLRANRSSPRPHAAQHTSDQRLGGTLPHRRSVGLPLLSARMRAPARVTLAARRQVRDGQAGGSQLPVSSDAAAARREHPTRESALCTAAWVPPPPGTPEIVRLRTGTAFDSRHDTPRHRAIRGHVRRMRALRRHAAPG